MAEHATGDAVSVAAGHRSVSEQIRAFGPWFHNLHLPGGQQTAPDHWLGDFPSYKWQRLAALLPADLSGWTALDIGCNAGYYSIELACRGAAVHAIDIDPHYLRQARWAVRQFGVEARVEFDQMQVYELARRPRSYDLVLFMGVMYHLRYPLLALEVVARRVKRLLAFQTLMYSDTQTVPPPPQAAPAAQHSGAPGPAAPHSGSGARAPARDFERGPAAPARDLKPAPAAPRPAAPGTTGPGAIATGQAAPAPAAYRRDLTLGDRGLLAEAGWPRLAFIEDYLQGDPTNWWVPNEPAVEALLRAAGMRVIARPGEEIYVCEPDRAFHAETRELDEAEYRAALGL